MLKLWEVKESPSVPQLEQKNNMATIEFPRETSYDMDEMATYVNDNEIRPVEDQQLA